MAVGEAVELWEPETGEPAVWELDTSARNAGARLTAMAAGGLEQGQVLAAGDALGWLTVWRPAGQAPRWAAVRWDVGDTVRALAVATDGGRVLAGGDGGVGRLWELPLAGGAEAALPPPLGLRGHLDEIICCALAGEVAATGGSDGTSMYPKIPCAVKLFGVPSVSIAWW